MIGDPPSLAAFFEIWRRNPGYFLRYEGDFGSSRLSYASAAGGAAAFAKRLAEAEIARGERVVIWGGKFSGMGDGTVGLSAHGSCRGSHRLPFVCSSHAPRGRDRGGASTPAGGRAGSAWSSLPRLAALFCFDEDKRSRLAIVSAALDDIAEILFTSGATGEPRGVTITHRNILANLKPIDAGIAKYRKYMGPFSPIRFLNLLPLSHLFGQTMAAFIPPIISGEVFFMSGFNPRDAARLIRRRRISVLVCVPQMLELLREFIEQSFPEALQPPRSRKWYGRWWQYRRIHRRLGWKFWCFIVGAAPLDPALEEFWSRIGYVVIQGYGLTETAPVATLNHPLNSKKGTVGKPIEGVEIQIAADGEILLRGDNITPGYYGEGEIRDSDGWLHTGDIGELDAERRLKILGRKKEMIVSPDGLNVYPEDVERVLNDVPGVRESAVVAEKIGSREQVHAVMVLDSDTAPDAVVSRANSKLEAHQRIKGYSRWPGEALPRTSGTNKLKRVEIAKHVAGEAAIAPAQTGGGEIAEVLRKFAGNRPVDEKTSLDDLGLSSLDRIQLMMELEHRTGKAINETQFGSARSVSEMMRDQPSAPAEPLVFPEWNRRGFARGLRKAFLPAVILPLTRAFAWIRTEGLENLDAIEAPVIFAVNHQSHFDVPAVLAALPPKWRYRVAPAMAKEFFEGHFHPERHSWLGRFTSSLNYYLSALVFHAFPLPQREAGTRDALRYAGDLASDGLCILIFPEGRRTDAGEIQKFLPGVGMLAARLRVPVVPVRLEGLERVLHKSAKYATPGRAKVKFGPALTINPADDYQTIASQIEEAVRKL